MSVTPPRKQISTLLLPSLLLSSLISGLAWADDDKFSKVDIIPTQLTPTSYMFVGSGGNIGVSAGEDGLLIIDDQFAPLADKISQALGKIQAGKPKFIINTHYHGDHTGGNGHFGQNGTIMAHENVLKRLASDSKYAASALPVITYDQGISVHFNGDTLKVVHLGPGHTDGDSVVMWQEANVVHMGDLFFKDRFPYVDLTGGGSVLGYRDNVTNILGKLNANTKIIPGHGELANLDDLVRFKHMLDDSINWMNSQLAEGKTLDAIKQQGVPEKWKTWAWQFISEERWIDTLYQGLNN